MPNSQTIIRRSHCWRYKNISEVARSINVSEVALYRYLRGERTAIGREKRAKIKIIDEEPDHANRS